MMFLSLALMLWSAQLQFIEASTPIHPVRVSYRKHGYSRDEHCSVYCPSLDALFVIGGNEVSDPEVYNFNTEEWSDPVKIVGPPANVGRSCHLSLLESSAEHCTVVVVGGNEREPLEARMIKLSEPDENKFEIEWLVSENPERSGSLGGYMYCGTAVKNTIYILGGVDNYNQLTDRFLQVEVNFNSSSGSFVTHWTDLSTSEDSQAPPPLAGCGLASTDSDKLVLYGGSGLGNEMRYYDITMNRWLESFQTGDSGKFVRDGLSLTFYDGKVYMYGGTLNDGQLMYPRQLYSMTPTVKPQSNCAETAVDSISNEIPLWCMYDESVGKLPYNGVSSHSCAMRESQLVCTFGSSLKNDQASRRMVIFDLDIMKNHLTMATEEFWIPLDMNSVVWIPLVVYLVTCIVIGSYLHIKRKQSNVSGDTATSKVLGSPTTTGQHPNSRLEEGKNALSDTMKILDEDSESKDTLVVPVDGIVSGNSSTETDSETKQVDDDSEPKDTVVVTVDGMVSGNSSTESDSETKQDNSKWSYLPVEQALFAWLLSVVGVFTVPQSINRSPVTLMVFNVLLNLSLTYTVTHWFYWYGIVRQQQKLAGTELMCRMLYYGDDRTSNRTRFGWVFVDLAGIAGMSAGLASSWIQAKEYWDLNKDKPGILVINFHDNTLFSVLSLSICFGIACYVVILVLWIGFGTFIAFTKGCNEIETASLDENSMSKRIKIEEEGRIIPPAPNNTSKHVESECSTSSYDVDVGMKNDATMVVKNDHSSIDETKPSTDSETTEKDSDSSLFSFVIGSGLLMAFFVLYLVIDPHTGLVVVLPFVCIPGNITFWTLVPCHAVYSQYNEVVVEKERSETADRTISIRTSTTWFALFALVLAESIALLTFAYLQSQELWPMLLDGHSIQFILGENWLLWVVCAPTIIAGAFGAPLVGLVFAAYGLLQSYEVIAIPVVFLLECMSSPFRWCLTVKKLKEEVVEESDEMGEPDDVMVVMSVVNE